MIALMMYLLLGLWCALSARFGWMGQVQSFLLLLAACIFGVALILSGLSPLALRSQLGLMALAATAMFLASGYGMGFIAARAKANRNSDE